MTVDLWLGAKKICQALHINQEMIGHCCLTNDLNPFSLLKS